MACMGAAAFGRWFSFACLWEPKSFCGLPTGDRSCMLRTNTGPSVKPFNFYAAGDLGR